MNEAVAKDGLLAIEAGLQNFFVNNLCNGESRLVYDNNFTIVLKNKKIFFFLRIG